jgi:hypothetical protein
MGVGVQRHAPAALPLGKTRYPLYRRLGGPQGRSGRVRKISPPPGFDPRTAQTVDIRYTDWAISVHNRLTSNVWNNSFVVLLQHIVYISTVGKTDDLFIYRIIYLQRISLVTNHKLIHSFHLGETLSGLTFERLNVISFILYKESVRTAL